jgi:hypothetical protein
MQTDKSKAFFRVFFSLTFDDWLPIGYFREMPGCVKVVHRRRGNLARNDDITRKQAPQSISKFPNPPSRIPQMCLASYHSLKSRICI